jgi:hypothetical protein
MITFTCKYVFKKLLKSSFALRVCVRICAHVRVGVEETNIQDESEMRGQTLGMSST